MVQAAVARAGQEPGAARRRGRRDALPARQLGARRQRASNGSSSCCRISRSTSRPPIRAARAAYDKAGGNLGAHAQPGPAGRAVRADVRQAVRHDHDAVASSRLALVRAARRDGGGVAGARAGAAAVRDRGRQRHGRRRHAAAALRAAPTRARSTTSSRASAACDREDATLLIGASASQLSPRSSRSRCRRADARKQRGRAHRAALLLLGPRQGRLAASGRDALPVDGHQGAHRARRRSTCASRSSTRADRACGSRARKGARKAPAFEIQADSAARRQGAGDPDLQHVRRGLAGIGRDRRQLLLAPPGERPARRRRQIGRRPRDAVRGLRLRVRPHRRRHRRERRRRAAPDLQLRPGRQRRPGADRRRRAARGRLPSTRSARAGSITWWTARASSPPRSARPTAPTAASRWRPAATASSAGCPDRLRVGEIDVPRGQLVALAEARLRDAPFSDDPVKGARPRRPDVALVAGRGRHVPIRLRSAERRQPVPTDRHAGRRLVAAKLFTPRLGLEPRRRGRIDRRRRHAASARRSSSARCRWRRR